MDIDATWLELARLSGRVDPARLDRRALERLDERALVEAGVPRRALARLAAARGRRVRLAGRAITWFDRDYPALLRSGQRPPPVLFVEGDAAQLDRPAVAVVGARACTTLAREMARRVAAGLARAGAVVVSGLAWGVDAAAHAGAGAATIGVMPQGLAAPRTGHLGRACRAVLEAGGLLVSEFPPDARATRRSFPQRNRVIAGLARAVLVVEARERSGSLITARIALETGREVLAVPDHPLRPEAAGTLALVAAGALPVRSVDDVLAAAGLERPRAPPCDPLVAALGGGATAEEVALRLGRPFAEVERRLVELELSGDVQRLPGERYAPRS